MRPTISPEAAQDRLKSLFQGAFDTTLFNPLAGYAVSSMIYVGAVFGDEPETWARPSTVYWQRPGVLTNRTTDEERAAWRAAASRSSAAVEKLLTEWGVTEARRYADTTREPLRDETWRGWQSLGAARRRTGIPTSSSAPTWALEPHFADLFDPALNDVALTDALDAWVAKHLEVGARLKVQVAHERQVTADAVEVHLPSGVIRSLEPGNSSRILKGVIEQWAPAKLSDPVVLAISESAQHVYIGDSRVLGQLGVTIDHSNLLPDAIIADLTSDGAVFWVVEAVASDGPITEERKRNLQRWAESQRINPDHLRFLTAFESRNASPARRRLKDLAQGTYAWYLDEPGMELVWVPLT